MVEITGIIEEVVFRNEDNGFTVIEVRDESSRALVTAVGSLPYANAGEKVHIVGEWTMHPDYGQQLKIHAMKSVVPSTLDGMEKYLASGLIKGVGPSTAKKLIERFGMDVLNVIEFSPERLTEVEGIGPARAEMIAASYAEHREIREVMMFLQSYGITTTYAIKIYKMYGNDAIGIIKENPYRLADEVTGIGFKTADRIAQNMGVAFDSPYRIAAGIKYVLSQAAADGHTYLPRDILVEQASLLLGVDKSLVENAIISLAVQQSVFIENIEGQTAVYLAPFYYAEVGVCRRLVELSMVDVNPGAFDIEEMLRKFQKEEGILLALKQREAVIEALSNGVTVITGGPGTGKTTIINCIIKLMEQQGMTVVLAAPTGRAAKRMTETTGREARTIHRLLEYSYSDEGPYFQKDEDDPILADAVIIDEVSMVDVLLMNHLLKAIVPGTRLILVGDVDQLPSVGPGNVLKDIISSGIIKVVRLTEIFRQAQESMIVLNAHRINQGHMPYLNVKGGDFFFSRRETPQQILNTVLELICRRLPAFADYNPLRDIQVLVPMRKGAIGVNNLNNELQRVLNPPSAEKQEKLFRNILFREGDKVMQIKNNYRTPWKRKVHGMVVEEGEGVFNGDIGYIAAIDHEEQSMTVIFDDDKEVVYDFSQLDELELAYAISIHKSQGSEFPVVIIPLAWGPPMLMTRNLLYTAVTRAREMVIIVGRERAIEAMVRNDYVEKRYSGLTHHFRKLFAVSNF
ncbi:SF1B family DNA helicase RecD2 [Caldicoprobacter faecalis]|uniref:ATP-dependent RecD2 DNA helicase n=1 Tax=Caldicoprobacter faecalis TaxID=937334 RepID=A0A1I5V672_9FIRM|nr:ATP-dependent RecD-like DNA helicase [Caldicoprobacter faecalis]PZN11260.1 MAG: ATP-dependent RecD-like DNA helicase [Caldicoprobacter oshimai]SFQ03034.1 exodeoxyribonuclease V alpha subunit [Caldicoprobacter faecalis]